MPVKSSAFSSSKELLPKLNELLECAARLSPKEKRRLIEDPKSLVGRIGPAKTDMSKWKKEIKAFLSSRGPVVERVMEPVRLSKTQIRRQVELYQVILEKLGISEEVAELSAMKPEGGRKS